MKTATARPRPKTGEFWYRMQDATGKTPSGYAWMKVSPAEDGGFSVDWKLKLSYPGGSYEEDRGMAVDGTWRLRAASYAVSGETLCEGRREGAEMTGRAKGKDGQPADFRVAVPDDAATGMSFVFTPALPRDGSAAYACGFADEANGFKPGEGYRFDYKGAEQGDCEGRTIRLHRFDRVQGKLSLPVWVDEEGRIVKADWGNNCWMVLSPTPTSGLFKP